MSSPSRGVPSYFYFHHPHHRRGKGLREPEPKKAFKNLKEGVLFIQDFSCSREELMDCKHSRAPLPADKENMNDELMESTNIYMDNIDEHLPARQSFLDNLREHLKSDSVCSNVLKMWTGGLRSFTG